MKNMLSIIIMVLALTFSVEAQAQGPSKTCPTCGLSMAKCKYKGKHPKPSENKPAANKPKPASVKVSDATGYDNGHGYVDLGLSVMWATCNVDASSPEGFGGYYAWGETSTKSNYTWGTCFDCLDDNGDNWGFYKTDGKTKLEPSSGHDTARENWGGSWRMPTIEELEELYSKCTWKWGSKGGYNGYVVTGPNGNSIFLPVSGYRYDKSSNRVNEYGCYWSSTLSPFASYGAQYLLFGGSIRDKDNNLRSYGFSVRPVFQNQPIRPNKPVVSDFNGHDWVDLGLSVKWATCNVGAESPEEDGGYYAWGETTTKSEYTFANCFDCLDDNGDNWGFYNVGSNKRIEPDSGHDTARENWGGTWRMPTDEELAELSKKCTWKWTSKGGHNGYVVTGPNGNSIFLPVAGCRLDTGSYGVGEYGHYWSSTLDSGSSDNACGLGFNNGYHSTNYYNRLYGRSVRPVSD